jgi:hypothetical protein
LKKILLYIFIVFLAFACINEQIIKQKVWTVSYKDGDSNFTSFVELEVYDSNGDLVYDSVRYPQDYGYKISRYYDNLLFYEYSKINPDFETKKKHTYKDNILIKTITYSSSDTLIANFEVEAKNEFGKPLKILTKNTEGEILGVENRLYLDTLLLSKKVYLRNDSSDKLINQKDINYNSSRLKIYELTTDYLNSVKDSSTFDYDETGLIRKVTFTKLLRNPEYKPIKEKHFYRAKNGLYEMTEYNFLDKKEFVYKAEINFQ